MSNIKDVDALLPTLPIAERIPVRDRLDESMHASILLSYQVMEQPDIDLMEKRLADYDAGLVPSVPLAVFRLQMWELYGLQG